MLYRSLLLLLLILQLLQLLYSAGDFELQRMCGFYTHPDFVRECAHTRSHTHRQGTPFIKNTLFCTASVVPRLLQQRPKRKG